MTAVTIAVKISVRDIVPQHLVSAEAGGVFPPFRIMPFITFFSLIQTLCMLCLSVACTT